MKSKFILVQRVEFFVSRINEKEVLKSVFFFDMDKIKQILEQIDENVFNQVVDEIVNVKRIYIIGIRSFVVLVDFLGFYLNMILDNVKVIIISGISDIFEF